MPSSYAHYRFGQAVFPELPEDIRLSAQRFRQLYDVGLHGPDLFFFYQPLFHTKLGELGSAVHALSGREFFETAAARLRENPSEGATVYLFGVLGHYVLDSACHPLIRQIASEGAASHVELETEFDRWLLTQDGKEPPHTQNLGRHMKLTWGECVTVSECYPPATAYTIRRCLGIMSMTYWALAWKNRELLQWVFSLGGQYGREMIMYPRPNHKCAQWNQPLSELFGQALERYPRMAAKLAALIQEQCPLDEDFDPIFG